jgi:hypothetical protein
MAGRLCRGINKRTRVSDGGPDAGIPDRPMEQGIDTMASDPSRQRLFEHPSGHLLLLTKDGAAVHFQVDGQQQIRILRKLDGVDFKATGDGLLADGWRCVGPGLEYSRVLAAPAPDENPE